MLSRLSFVFAPPKVRHGMRDRRKIPTTGRQGADFAVASDVEICRPSRRNCRFELRGEVGGLLDRMAVGPHGFRHHRVVSRKKIPVHISKAHRQLAVFTEVAALLIPDGAITEVVPYEPNYRDLVLDGGEHGTRVHHECAISTHRDDTAIASPTFGADRTCNRESPRSQTPR